MARYARTSARFPVTCSTIPPSRTFASVAVPLEGRLRQSLREHVAGTLMSYLAMQQAAAQQPTGKRFPPRFPSRLRPEDLSSVRDDALAQLNHLADNPRRERALVAALQQTRQVEVVAIPFVGVDARYRYGLYFNRQTRRFYARLDVVGAQSRYGRPITARGEYIDVKTGLIYTSAPPRPSAVLLDSVTIASTTVSFGRVKKAVLVPLEMGRYHESALRYAPVAFLPHRGVDGSHPEAAIPMAAHLVRRRDAKREGGVRYELHVAFRIPVPEADLTQTRPLLALNRGIRQLYAVVLTDSIATVVERTAVTSGAELRTIQFAHERARRDKQRRGASTRSDRQQGRIAKHHIALLANEIVALARRENAQVVVEDLTAFSAPGGMRASIHATRPVARAHAQRAILNRRQFAALQQAIDARLEVLGLPLARTVNAAFISRDCPQCGARQELVPTDQPGRFVCATCGFSGDRDLVAAANVARRFVWLRLRGEEKQAGIAKESREPWERFAARYPIVWKS
jgi:hypothetical protein